MPNEARHLPQRMRASRALWSILMGAICMVCVFVPGCSKQTGDGNATNTATPSSSGPSPTGQVLTVRLSEDFDIALGELVRVESTEIELSLSESHGPPPGCFDCPNRVTLVVQAGNETQVLNYSLSGNMSLDALQKARRLTAFGFTFIAVKIAEGNVTLRVEPIEE